MWKCPVCDSNNDSINDKCFVCGTIKPIIYKEDDKRFTQTEDSSDKKEEGKTDLSLSGVDEKDDYKPPIKSGYIKLFIFFSITIVLIFILIEISKKRRDDSDKVEKYNESTRTTEVLYENETQYTDETETMIDEKENEKESTLERFDDNVEEETQTIEQKTQESSDKKIWLTDLEYLKNNSVKICSDKIGQANTGEEYSHYIFSDSPYGEIVYDLNGKYDFLTALWSICYTNRDTKDNNYFEIYADERLVYKSPSITGGDLPINISVDIEGCDLLTIIFIEGHGCAELANIQLTGDNYMGVISNGSDYTNLPCWLTDLEYFHKSGVEIRNNSIGTANTGETYSHYIFGKANDEIQYYLNGKYRYISGVWCICQENSDTDDINSFEIYADDEIVYTSPDITSGDFPVEVKAEINNCVILKIVFKSGNGAAEFGNIRIVPGDDSSPHNISIEIDDNKNWLTEMDYLVNDGVSIQNSSVGVSNTNEEYSHYLFGEEGEEIQYYLNGKYRYISGVWCICQANRDTENLNSFEIYADDELIYQSPSLTGGNIPVMFKVDINYCQKLRIVFTAGNGAGELGNIFLE